MAVEFVHPVTGRPFGLRLDTLVRLRWLAVVGQLIVLVSVYWGLGFDLPIVQALGIVALTAAINVALGIRYAATRRLDDREVAILLTYDIAQLAWLLYLTGGISNPFCVLFLAPVLISAAALSPRTTLVLGALTVAAITLIALYYHPLPWYPGQEAKVPVIYRVGIWLALLVSVVFIGLYAWRIAEERSQLSDALAATELVLAREQHLSALDGLAAAAAHELGTPLSTVVLVVRELERGPAEGRASCRRHQAPARADRALPFHPGDACYAWLGRYALRPHAVVALAGGSSRAPPAVRRRDQTRSA